MRQNYTKVLRHVAKQVSARSIATSSTGSIPSTSKMWRSVRRPPWATISAAIWNADIDLRPYSHDPDSDFWIAADGGCFIKNVFIEDAPVWIEAGEREWRGRHLNLSHVLYWPPGFPPVFSDAARLVIHECLKTQAPSGLSRYSRQLIQDVLQHDSPQSAKAYIDSVGADTLPLFEQMNDRLGSRFSELKNAWFQGRIIDTNRSAGPPIIVPGPMAPAVVGACGSASSCQHHPLFSCYLCQYFLAFRQANHMKALDFIEHEYQRWRDAEIGASRSKAMKDFERTAAGIQDVMDRIDQETERDKL